VIVIAREAIAPRCVLLTLDRPAKRNALDADFWPELSAVLEELERDEEVGAVVLTGAGDRAFSAGGDIAGFADLDSLAAVRSYEHVCFGAFRKLESFAKPIVAAVNGFALAGGCEIAFACDVVVAAADASFGVPEVRVGLSAGYASVRFDASMRHHAIRSLTLTGRRVGAAEARALGLVQLVTAADELLPTCVELAATAAAAPPTRTAAAKALVDRRRRAGDLDAVMDALCFLHLTDDKFEGVAAFAGGRAPRFKGR
jgi:enoyl-CoA hydratase